MKMIKMIPLFVILSWSSCFATHNIPGSSQHIVQIDALFKQFDRSDAPGAAVLVQIQGQNVYKKCFGMASLEHQIPITPQTRFDLASVSKHLTAFAVLLLENEGKLNLNDDIRTYLPELSDLNQPVTIKHLLYQSSGLWEFWTILNTYSGFRSRDYFNMNDVLHLLRSQPELNFRPGTKYAYTNTNYSLIAEIIKRVSGESFADWTGTHIFEPLGMHDTFFQEDCKIPIPNQATAYRKRNEKYILARPSNVEIPGSAHAFTTLDDMAKWINNLRTGKLGGDAVMKNMFTRGQLNNGEKISYAAGLIISDYKGFEIIKHSGQTGGYKTMLIVCPEKELSIVILANERSIGAYDLAHQVLDIYFGKTEQAERRTDLRSDDEFIEMDISDMNKYVGGYRIEKTNEMAGFYLDGDLLVGAILGLGKEYLFPISKTEFVDYSRTLKITFHLNQKNKVNQATILLGPDQKIAYRLETESEISVNDYTGIYCCPALGSICTLFIDDKRLTLLPHRKEKITLYQVEPELFVCRWGFICFNRSEDKGVSGFILKDEVFGFSDILFSKVANKLASR